jgi:hypothetical protein
MDPLGLDWGASTPEFANEEQNSAVHILQHDITTSERAERSLRFARARVAAFGKKQPGCKQEVWFDDREQAVPAEVRAMLKDGLAPHAAAVTFFSEGEA